MSAEANKMAMRRFLKGLDQRNLDVIDEVFAPDYVWHLPTAISPVTRCTWPTVTTGISSLRHRLQ